jgi:AcrR family transcriptional regulator
MKVNNKEKIFHVSIDLFSKYGFDGVSVRQIAGEVGIKESSIYNHYPNKQAILNSILDYYIAEMTSEEIPLNQASLNLDMGFDFFYRAGCDAFLSKLREDKMMKLEKKIVVLFFASLALLTACGDDNSTSKAEESGSVIGPDGKVIPDSILMSDSLYTWYLDMLAKGEDPLSPNSSANSEKERYRLVQR